MLGLVPRLVPLLLLLLAMTVLAADRPRRPPKGSGLPIPLEPEEYDTMPSRANPDDDLRMTCSACTTSLLELFSRFRGVHREFKHLGESHIKEYHLLAATEGMCDKEAMHYGLARPKDEDKTRPIFVNEHAWNAGTVMKGGWVTALWRQECIAMMARIEDDLPQIFSDLLHRRLEVSGKKQVSKVFCPICAAMPDEEAQEGKVPQVAGDL